jgi:hypothetical protein
MQDPSEVALSAIEFGLKRTAAGVRGAAEIGLSLTRSVLGAAARVVMGTGSARPDAGGAGAWTKPVSTPEPSPPLDPERERRMALRDTPPETGNPHHALNNPVTDEPDPTEWPDPYDRREDPRDPDPDQLVPGARAPHTPTGSQSTSSPHPSQDPQAARRNGPKAPDSPR